MFAVRLTVPCRLPAEADSNNVDQPDEPNIDADDLRTHCILTSSLSASNNPQVSKTKDSKSSTKALGNRALRRKRSMDSEEDEMERMTDASQPSPSRLAPQKKRRRFSPPRTEVEVVIDIPAPRNNVEREDGYGVRRVEHDVSAWKAPSFVESLAAPSKPKIYLPHNKPPFLPARKSTSTFKPNFPPSRISVASTTSSKNTKKLDIQTMRSGSVVSGGNDGNGQRSRSAQISDKVPSSSSSRKTTAEPPPPSLQTTSHASKSASVSPPPAPRLNIDFSSITQERGPKWLTWRDAADVLTLIGRFKNLRGGPAR